MVLENLKIEIINNKHVKPFLDWALKKGYKLATAATKEDYINKKYFFLYAKSHITCSNDIIYLKESPHKTIYIKDILNIGEEIWY